MKRYLAAALAIILLIAASSAWAESAVQLQCSFSETGTEYDVGFEIRNVNGVVSLLSNLTDDGTIIPLSEPDEIPFLNLSFLNDETLTEKAIQSVVRHIERWFETLEKPEARKGVYAGELFAYAEEEQTAEFKAEDIDRLIQSIVHTDEEVLSGMMDANPYFSHLLLQASEKLKALSEESETGFLCKSYDGGKYISLNLIRNKQIVMVCSADLSDFYHPVFRITHAEDGKLYHRQLTLDHYGDRTEICMVFSSSDPSLSGGEKMFMTDRTVIERTESAFRFHHTLCNGNSEETLITDGDFEIDRQGCFTLRGEMYFPENQQRMQYRLSTCGEQVSDTAPHDVSDTNGKKKEDLKQAFGHIVTSFRFLKAAAALIRVLPSEFSEIAKELLISR